MSKIKKTLLTMACMCITAGMISFGCSPERLEESKKPKVEYPGMLPYDTNSEWPDDEVSSYVAKLLAKNTHSAKKGLTTKIPLDGELVSLTTFYQYGTPKNAERDKDGYYPTECMSIIQHKVFRHLNPKEMSTTPMYTEHGKVTMIDYDYGLDKKIDVRIIVQEKYIPGRDVVKTQELDIGADGTIEERLVISPYEDYTFEKALK